MQSNIENGCLILIHDILLFFDFFVLKFSFLALFQINKLGSAEVDFLYLKPFGQKLLNWMMKKFNFNEDIINIQHGPKSRKTLGKNN